MPYEHHSTFETPSGTTVLWRYMTLTKLISVLATRSLWFSRADLLNDRHEGAVGLLNLQLQRSQFEALGQDAASIDKIMANMSEFRRRVPHGFAVNCWHEGQEESAAMWSAYGLGEGSVAIQTTVDDLIGSFRDNDLTIYLGRIQYIDYSTQGVPANNIMAPMLFKRRSYQHEREVRAAVAALGRLLGTDPEPYPAGGLSVPVDVDQLIRNVVVAPSSPEWVVQVVEAALHSFGSKAGCWQSDLDGPALF